MSTLPPITVATPGPDQTTLAATAEVRGTGFVTGADLVVRFLPAPADSGLAFQRVDLPGTPIIPARIEFAVARQRRTALANGSAQIELTEHVLAALVGLGIDNCLIQVNGPEMPGLDGSALAFVEALDRAGTTTLGRPRRLETVERSVSVAAGAALVAAHPPTEPGMRVTFHLLYDNPGVAQQCASFVITPEIFRRELAPCRTFVLEREVAWLRQQGIGLRHTAADLLVFREDGTLVDNNLRFRDECVRHKILDVVGDLALLGCPLQAHVFADRSGHELNRELVKAARGAEPLRGRRAA